jgi:hypothetical protein
MAENEERTYTIQELAELIRWNPAAIKVIARKLNIDPAEPIEEEDAAAIAKRVRRAWPPER